MPDRSTTTSRPANIAAGRSIVSAPQGSSPSGSEPTEISKHEQNDDHPAQPVGKPLKARPAREEHVHPDQEAPESRNSRGQSRDRVRRLNPRDHAKDASEA